MMIELNEEYRNIQLDVYSEILNKDHSYTLRVNKRSEASQDNEIVDIIGVLKNMNDDEKELKEHVIVGDWKLKHSEFRKLKHLDGIMFFLTGKEAKEFAKSDYLKNICDEMNNEDSKGTYGISAYANGIMCIYFKRKHRV